MSRIWIVKKKRAYVSTAILTMLASMIFAGLYLAGQVTTNVSISAEPSNVAAVHQAERGALQQRALIEFYSEDCLTCRQVQGPMTELDEQFDGKTRSSTSIQI